MIGRPSALKLVLGLLALVSLFVVAAGSNQVAEAHWGYHDSTVRVTGVVLAPGWTPPGISEVTLCAGPSCQSVTTGNLGDFSFESVPYNTVGRFWVTSGLGTCSYERFIDDPFFGTVNVGLLYCWR